MNTHDHVKKLRETLEVKEEAITVIENLKTITPFFDKKIFSKRFQTSIRKNVNKNICVKRKIDCIVIKYKTNKRMIGNTSETLLHVVTNSQYVDSIIDEDYRMIADNVIKELDKNQEYLEKTIQEASDQLPDIKKILKRYNELVKQCEEFNGSVSALIRNEFELHSFDNVKEHID